MSKWKINLSHCLLKLWTNSNTLLNELLLLTFRFSNLKIFVTVFSKTYERPNVLFSPVFKPLDAVSNVGYLLCIEKENLVLLYDTNLIMRTRANRFINKCFIEIERKQSTIYRPISLLLDYSKRGKTQSNERTNKSIARVERKRRTKVP